MIREVPIVDVLDSGLLDAYAKECAVSFLGAIKPDRQMYKAMEEALILKALGVFDGDTLTGFAVILTTVYPHYSLKMATVESIYVQGGGAELMAEVEAFARREKCTAIFCTAPLGGRFERLMHAKKSYQQTSSVFGKVL